MTREEFQHHVGFRFSDREFLVEPYAAQLRAINEILRDACEQAFRNDPSTAMAKIEECGATQGSFLASLHCSAVMLRGAE